ncbi:alcohol dehydrogenase GroES-like domain-containing protein [Colletotrichum lupini]|uniref:Alcohol dehydrogenase GroES-like domain-containing protein n=1 Tax=Colletotrichum lupini TaxID=145971 RepID=A0A9Q8SCZ2_9PEZI|nr:alcohol dehydrogenase GroES-like domain-containing protein [Colletotrichum lupini]UQC74793.1 alcohol dehydrogenase GroES-like domain-containing protein [Colletotrichum lupini]
MTSRSVSSTALLKKGAANYLALTPLFILIGASLCYCIHNMAFNITNATMSTMRAVAWFGQPYNVSVIDMPVPTIVNQTDVVVRITSSAICGSDLHTYHGFGGSPNVPYGFGHEAVGYVSSVGDAVSGLEVGDYVIIPDNADDGHWGPSHPLSFGVGSANYGGLQVRSETARIDIFRSKRQPKLTQSSVLYQPNYLMISDVFKTGWHVLSYSGFQPSDTVAIFGAGPVGLLAAYSAKLRGTSRVYVVDRIASRLGQAGSFGAIPIDFSQQDPVGSLAFESINATGDPHNGIVLENMVAVTSVYGGMGIGGVYNGEEGLVRRKGYRLVFAEGTSFAGLDRICGIEDAPEYYRRYSDHLENKVVIRFP